MRILYINHYAGSSRMGMEFRPYYLAQEWRRLGHETTIVAADFSHLRRQNPDIQKDLEESSEDGIRYVWLRCGAYDGNGSARAATMFRFVFKLRLYARTLCRRYRPDVVITSSTYPLDTYPGQAIARRSGAKLIHEIHDMWPATLVELGGMSERHPFVRLLDRAETSFCRHSDAVVSILPLTQDYICAKGLPRDAWHYIPNGVYLPDWQTEPSGDGEGQADGADGIPMAHVALFKKLQADGAFVIGYFGGHALSNGLESVLELAARMRGQKLAFVLVGDGVQKAELMERAREMKLSDVHFLDPVAKTQIPALLRRFDLVFVTGHACSLYRFGGGMNKLFDAMMAAKPVLLALDLPGNPIVESGCGSMCSAGDYPAMQEAVEAFMAMSPEARRAMGEKGREAALTRYNYANLARRFAQIFEDGKAAPAPDGK